MRTGSWRVSRTITEVPPLLALREALEAAAAAIGGDAVPPSSRLTLERPKKAGFGDYATNAAMLLAPVVGAPPRDVAGQVGAELGARLGDRLDRVEVAGPGFLNLFLSDGWHASALADVLESGDRFGAGSPGAAERILVEFVSANPTGPLTAASGRHAAFGDALSRLLGFAGHHVDREFYVNDAGSQVAKLGLSIQARARGEEVPEDGYQGEYVAELAEQIPGAADADPAVLAERGVELMLERNRATMEAYRVTFDSWFSERSLYAGEPNAVDHAYEQLEAHGHLYRSEGALWLRTTDTGDDKDRVLERSSGEPTYFSSDIAYHGDKLVRGYDRLIDVFGADHHGYIGRMKAAVGALGTDPERLEILIMQFVHVVEGGERSKMSKRAGEFITLDDLIGEIGVDATRFFMLSRSHDTTVDLDLDLAKRQSNENPVYYVQYAHARIASIRAKAGEERVAEALRTVGVPPAVQLEPAERALIKKLLSFPDEVAEAAARRAPHRITAYALELAQAFTAFYRDCQVVGAEGDGVEDLRLALCVASQRTIATSLGLLGVTAPDAM
ncbi:MAG: arginyl-tRNA synthetase [Solirubrobacteraceae bacterium]|nr:arginyl-tRNA synthetase [Solirubrobacteraceae bacterium]